MQIWQIQSTDGAGQLRQASASSPACGPEDIRVAVRSVGINRADLLQMRGLYPAPPGAPADIPGLEYAGEIVETGARVRARQVGDRVMGLVAGGAYATELVVHELDTLPVPANLGWAEAAAFPEAYLTAYRALFLEGGIQPGQWALIRAATSVVGIAGLQLLRTFGSFSVGSSRHQERLDQLGADMPDVPLVDAGDNLPEAVRTATDGGADVALDMLGGEALAQGLEALRDEGCLVLIGLLQGRKVQLDTARLLFRRLTIRAMTMRTLPLGRRLQLMSVARERLLPHLARGTLNPRVAASHDFSRAPEAIAAMQQGEHVGKIVLTVG
ncbi:NADPH2:quinone reductase [Natronocella acetinitrilica]|uniref:NADPH2:quinone reductase n=1 Tax=Natronocella acetinitrilica TaxID=414046 RepID=A0AAE3G2E4_9GAMM|nr:NADPH2:quinone reductase [Natronocella acetinitrilica]